MAAADFEADLVADVEEADVFPALAEEVEEVVPVDFAPEDFVPVDLVPEDFVPVDFEPVVLVLEA